MSLDGPGTGATGATGAATAVAQGPPALQVHGVAVNFGGVAALSGVSLSVAPGTVTGLIGPNGAGKTTLFNVISGLQRPDRGSVHIGGTDVTKVAPYRRARLGMARTFQRLELFGSMSSEENVLVGVEALHHRALTAGSAWDHEAGAAARARVLLERVSVGEAAAHLVNSLPTGQARLVELARALALDPRLLLLDEPCAGLDEAESAALGALLRQLAAEGRAVLLVEHDMDLVLRVCDRIHVLDFGEIIASGSPDEIRRDPRVQAAYLGQMEAPGGPG